MIFEVCVGFSSGEACCGESEDCFGGGRAASLAFGDA